MLRRVFPLLLAMACPSIASADGLTPKEAAKKMKLPPGFSVRPSRPSR